MPNTDLFAWYEEQLTREGWALEPSSSTNGAIFMIEVGHRRHFLRVEAGEGLGDLDADYSVQYTIDFAT